MCEETREEPGAVTKPGYGLNGATDVTTQMGPSRGTWAEHGSDPGSRIS